MLPSLDLGASVTMLGYGFIGFGFKRPGRFSDFKRLHALHAAGSLGGGERSGADAWISSQAIPDKRK